MKKKILGIAILAISIFALPAMAQNPAGADNGQCPDQKNCPVCPDKKKGDRKKAFNPFEGITLTDAQQQQVTRLEQNRKAARAEKAKQAREKKAVKDSTMRQGRQTARRDYLNQMKSILTPDQYVVFLENIVVNQQPQMGQGPKGSHGDRGQAQMRDGKKQKKDHAGRPGGRKGGPKGQQPKNDQK
ncbi:MAG: hypothetical protein NC336_09485 [Clostridium sp.]|nr:hypothetical protein [Clostridium sp.]